jgi:hypothetical protein
VTVLRRIARSQFAQDASAVAFGLFIVVAIRALYLLPVVAR